MLRRTVDLRLPKLASTSGTVKRASAAWCLKAAAKTKSCSRFGQPNALA